MKTLIIILCLGLPAQALTIEFLDVGQGDAILIRDGKTVLIDAGPSKNIVNILRRKGITTIDMVVVTHHHADHYGGMDEVIKTFHPKVFLATGSSHTSTFYLRLLLLIRNDNAIETIMSLCQHPEVLRKVQLDNATITILPQPPEDLDNENNNSIGLRLQCDKFSVLMTGDSEVKERAYWLGGKSELIQNCTILKLAHHGSKNGTDDRWLDIVHPKLAIGSMGLNNDFGHPDPEVIEMLIKHRIPFLRTDRDGTITIETDGKTWKILGIK